MSAIAANQRPFIMRKGISKVADLADGQTVGSIFGHGGGKAYYLDPTDGNDGNDGTTPELAVKTLPVAENLLADGENDVLYYIAGTSSITLTAEFVWDKSYAHFVGICAPVNYAQRARIFSTSSDENLDPLFLISGSGCVFENLYIFHGSTDVDALVNVKVTGSRNYFNNVHFAGCGGTNNIDGGASLNLDGSASENTFVNCTIGVDTVAAGTGCTGLLFSGGTGAIHTARNTFDNCIFNMKAGHAGSSFIELNTQFDLDRITLFRNCLFINLASTLMTAAFVMPAATAKWDKALVLVNSYMIGATDWTDGVASGIVVTNTYGISAAINGEQGKMYYATTS